MRSGAPHDLPGLGLCKRLHRGEGRGWEEIGLKSKAGTDLRLMAVRNPPPLIQIGMRPRSQMILPGLTGSPEREVLRLPWLYPAVLRGDLLDGDIRNAGGKNRENRPK